MKADRVLIQTKENDIYRTKSEHYGDVWEWLAKDLIAKKLHKCKYITRISDRNNYDGTRTVTVYYTGDTRRIYIINC